MISNYPSRVLGKRGIRPACRISSRRDGRQGCVINKSNHFFVFLVNNNQLLTTSIIRSANLNRIIKKVQNHLIIDVIKLNSIQIWDTSCYNLCIQNRKQSDKIIFFINISPMRSRKTQTLIK